ncbi:hypothetical protein SARC_08277 [Sphaeroforma arctica JP610]|uniref:Peptidase M50 domain-containing protein n=1 Tax=Sphaeroforma arctica JP610 TaxID=667725 RepID=A0A0L0FTR5_9EUKA|nr:hypothetical protein SARC_08277 [Sphaeroforma arctica JP610]KNC79328.1 hypothetical protein SARC_08277 [Sphaeroforma arctica JP610]|eukprot:XP_014153230.1 hypothetical protein SARC_08277 [Sphaeroforma arctica JP610]
MHPNERMQRYYNYAVKGALGGFLVMKKGVVALKIFKAAPVITMMLSSLAYSFVFGWPFAIGMVGSIFVHEMGHAIALVRYGIPISSMVFIPFMGAAVTSRIDKVHKFTADKDVVVAMAGPVVGGTAATVLAVLGNASDSQLLLSLADWGYTVNLFNMLPIGMLDGGHVAKHLHRMMGVSGLALGGGLMYTGTVTHPIFMLIMLSGAWTTGTRFFGQQKPHPYGSLKNPLAVFAGYLALCAALFAGAAWTKQRLIPAKEMPGYEEKVQKAHDSLGEYGWLMEEDFGYGNDEEQNEDHLVLHKD